jgi:rhodanese-related sulfurtransferase
VIQSIRPSQVNEWLEQCIQADANCRPMVLDVREPWEIQTSSIKAQGFELLHMPMNSVPARLNEIDPKQPLACLCHHGGRSAQVAQFLKSQGYDQVVNIHGGINAWSNEVDPSVPRY